MTTHGPHVRTPSGPARREEVVLTPAPRAASYKFLVTLLVWIGAFECCPFPWASVVVRYRKWKDTPRAWGLVSRDGVPGILFLFF